MESIQDLSAEYLRPARFIDADHPAVVGFAKAVAGEESEDISRAVALYETIRDRFRYDPYHIDLSPDAMKASALLERDYGFCIPKAALLCASARVMGIPARLGFATVRNHLTTPKLRRAMGTDTFVWHGFAELFLDGRWLKATPAFDRQLCDRMGVTPLAFDGRHDAVFQEADRSGNRFMEYQEDLGRYADVPLRELREALEVAYPRVVVDGVWDLKGRFEEDAVADRRERR